MLLVSSFRAGTWRADLWYNTIGPAFVPIALTAARAADPNVKLYINDYNVRILLLPLRRCYLGAEQGSPFCFQIETIGAKSNAHLALAQSMLNSSIPLDGIGCQGHLIVGESPSASSITANFARFAALGLEWAITGMENTYSELRIIGLTFITLQSWTSA